MKMILAAILVFQSGNLTLAFDPSAVNWPEVKSEVRWLNLFVSPSLLSLIIDDFEALKKLKSGGYYPPTKFPPGSFQGGIQDGRTKKTINNFQLSVINEEKYLIYTLGDHKTGAETFVIKENPNPVGKNKSKIRIVNGFPKSVLKYNPGAKKPPLEVAFGKSAEMIFDTTALRKLRVSAEKDGNVFDIPIDIIPKEDSNWICFIHVDGIDFKTIRLTTLCEGSPFYKGPEEDQILGSE